MFHRFATHLWSICRGEHGSLGSRGCLAPCGAQQLAPLPQPLADGCRRSPVAACHRSNRRSELGPSDLHYSVEEALAESLGHQMHLCPWCNSWCASWWAASDAILCVRTVATGNSPRRSLRRALAQVEAVSAGEDIFTPPASQGVPLRMVNLPDVWLTLFQCSLDPFTKEWT